MANHESALRLFHTFRPPSALEDSALVHVSVSAPLGGSVLRRVISSDLVGQRHRAMLDVDTMAQIR